MPELKRSAEERLRCLLATARENEAKLQRFQAMELRLMQAEDFGELASRLLRELPEHFALDFVTLTLADPDHELRRLLADSQVQLADNEGLRLLSTRADLARLAEMGHTVRLERLAAQRDRWLVPAATRLTGSAALLPLGRPGHVFGVLVLGSRDAARYRPDIAADFMTHLAWVCGICVENALNLQRLHLAGLTDPLTGVRNRRFLDARLEQELARSARDGTPLACLLMDVDHFKAVNDTHGHPAGDSVLQDVARRMAQPLRAADTLTRYGGEEFAALLPATTAEQACLVGERIRAAVETRPFPLEGGLRITVTVSVGVAVFEPARTGTRADDALRLTECADRALLAAKRAGRNRVLLASHS